MIRHTVKFESTLQGITDIGKRNKAFDALSERQQRMEIAWDLLGLIVSGRVEGSFSQYWSNDLRDETLECGTAARMQEVLVNDLPKCHVCARGGMMLSMIRLGNRVSPYDDSVVDGSRDNIRGFSYDEFRMMEQEYEHGLYGHPHYTNTTEKLANIACNVVTNGIFDLKDRTNYLLSE